MHFHTVQFYVCSALSAVGVRQFVAVNLADKTLGYVTKSSDFFDVIQMQ